MTVDPKLQSAAEPSNPDGASTPGNAPATRCLVQVPGRKSFWVFVDPQAVDGISGPLLNKTYAPPYQFHLIFDLVPPGGLILDLGAHIGTFSLFAAANGYRVVAVEASPANVTLLRAASAHNALQNLQIAPVAVSDHPGSVTFHEWGPYGFVLGDAAPAGGVSVRCTTVDAMISDFALPRVDFVKMDIEGSEVAATRGMARLLGAPDAPPVVFESNGHMLHELGSTPPELLTAFEDLGYECYEILPTELRRTRSTDLQLECVVDYLAVKKMPPQLASHYRLVGPLGTRQRIGVALRQLGDPNPALRAHIGRTLEHADRTLLGDRKLVARLDALTNDPDPSVRFSVAWRR